MQMLLIFLHFLSFVSTTNWVPANFLSFLEICWNSPSLIWTVFCCSECKKLNRRMETMTMERNVTSVYEYSNAFPFEKDFDQWHYKRWTEENWVSLSFTQKSEWRLTDGMGVCNKGHIDSTEGKLDPILHIRMCHVVSCQIMSCHVHRCFYMHYLRSANIPLVQS